LNQIAVVILNWNGKSFLERFLPAVIKFSGNARIIVADNASSDDSVAFLTQKHPAVEIIVLPENYGFAGGYNKALAQIDSEYFVLLNSDVEVTENWLQPMFDLLESDKNIAACQPKIKDWNRQNENYFEYAGAAGGYIDRLGFPFCRGRVFDALEVDNGQYDNIQEIFWASGACLFIRASNYKEIGGLDEFFFAHMEEIDLCWRIKNQGFKIMFTPLSTVYHVGGGTLDKSKPQKTFLNFRNSLLTLHKNLPKNKIYIIIIQRFCLDGLAGVKFLFEGKPTHTLAIIKAHFSFYGAMKQNRMKRKVFKHIALTGLVNKNIVYEFYLKKKKTFTDIVK
jgi:GT2 family glycosyltransferase